MVRLRDDLARFLAATAPEHDAVQAEMAAYSDEHGFPIIGPEAGGLLRLLARLTDAERVFELGSGYGYSAYWFLEGMDGGEVVLTEIDEDELEMARDFFERAGVADRATFERGDAVEILAGYDGPFDVVLMDHQKSRYAEAFDRLREKVRPGGVVVADNVVHGPIDFDDLLAYVEGGPVPGDDSTRGVGEYLDVLRDDDAYETSVLPVGSGVAVSVRVE